MITGIALTPTASSNIHHQEQDNSVGKEQLKSGFLSDTVLSRTTMIAFSILSTIAVGTLSVANPFLGTVIVGGMVIGIALWILSSCCDDSYVPTYSGSDRQYHHYPTGTHYPVGSRHGHVESYPTYYPSSPPITPSSPGSAGRDLGLGGHYPVGGRHGSVEPSGPPPPYVPPSGDDGHYAVGGRHGGSGSAGVPVPRRSDEPRTGGDHYAVGARH